MRTLTSSKIDKEAGGKEKLEVILWSNVAPCSTENVSICDRAVQTRIVLAQIGTTFSIIFTSSTCVTVHRCQGLTRLRLLESFNPTGIAARSRNLKFKRDKISSQDLILNSERKIKNKNKITLLAKVNEFGPSNVPHLCWFMCLTNR